MISLLLSPERIYFDARELQGENRKAPREKHVITTAPVRAIEREARNIKRARTERGELQTRDDKVSLESSPATSVLATSTSAPRP